MVRRSVRRFSTLGKATSSPELQHPDLMPPLSTEPTPTPTPTPLSMESDRPKRSVRSSMKGRAAVLSSWLKASPLTTSFIEDAYEGTSKQTRLNTLYNRDDISRVKHAQASHSGDFTSHFQTSDIASDSLSTTSIALPSSSSSSTSIESTTSSLKFVDKARVFLQNSRLEDDPIFEDLKKPNRLPPLEVRRYRASRHYPLDPSQPCSGAGRWLQSKRSS